MGSRLEKNSASVQKRIASHEFTDEGGEEYEESAFGGFGDYFRRKKLKLQNLDVEYRAEKGEKPQIFKGIVAHVTGYTQPPLHILHKELVQHGAGFLQYLDGKTMATHIIASAMPPRKSLDFTKYRVVKPAWVVDSIQAGKLLPWTDYRVIEEGPRQKTIKFNDGKMTSQSQQKSPMGYREQTQNSFYNSQLQKTSPLASQRSSSPFQSRPAFKTPSRKHEDIDEIDDDAMDIDTPSKPQPIFEHEAPASAQKPSSPEVMPPPPPPPKPIPGKPMTSEEHNAFLLSDPKIRETSAANPDFLSKYYSTSRLHHLSTWKADLKVRMQKMAAEAGVKKTTKRKTGSRRYILHVDFDSFFCVISLKKAPELVDKPVAVAHGTGTGSEIASCNYPARDFGVKNGMWMKRALELCPDLKVLPYDYQGYEEASEIFYKAILEVGGVVQSVSVDEALIDVTDIVLSTTGSSGVGMSEGSIYREQEKADEIARRLRDEVKKRTECDVSVGIGGNILLAKIALRIAKPAGQYQIRPEEVLDVVGELEVERLPGVAGSIGGRLEEMGIKLVKDIRQTTKERLTTALGPKTGEKLWEYARGIDKTEIGEVPIRKSVSADVNWGIRFIKQEEAEEFVRNLCKELERRLLAEGVKGKQLTMKIMRRASDAPLDPAKHLGHGKCDTFNKTVNFGVATHSAEVIGKEAVGILRFFKFSPGDLRGIGVQMTKLEPIKQSAAPEGRQKRLNFGHVAAQPAPRKEREQIEDDHAPYQLKRSSSGHEVEHDPITEDPLTPKKPKVHPALALAKANAADEKANTPLNVRGTQFILPSQVDPTVLAELPQDIRSKLIAQAKKLPSAASSRAASPAKPRSESPAISEDIPPDVDPEVWAALPEDMKAEIWTQYGGRPQPKGRPPSRQTVLPQSPRKNRIINHPQQRHSPSKRGTGVQKTLFGRGKGKQPATTAGTRLLQTNFVPANNTIPDLDPEFLAALPEDVRKEVEADHRYRKARLAFPPKRPPPPPVKGYVIKVPPPKVPFTKPAKLSFTQSTSGKVTDLAEVKKMVRAWHEMSRDEGPHETDVEVFGKYVKRVVTEEKDMEKARLLVKWLGWLVEEETETEEGVRGWREAVEVIKGVVQKGVGERGLGGMDIE
ncbi:putative DNA repair protein REV1 [Triangularia verruculosa]|uniref:DNA repair protein REV1 n=1 Tax=Triangularia verruculosa TaxID=2587418 RepID=A0AAN6XT98_9PEZI|nr:putative DNA repair protein REV1 [Triangularia verruculosa]